MSRYIDADEFYVSQTARCWGEPLVGTCTNDNVKLYDEIQKFPTADVAEVVRCKDCKYYTTNTELLGNVCNRLFTVFPMKPEDFCSYGERKDKE